MFHFHHNEYMFHLFRIHLEDKGKFHYIYLHKILLKYRIGMFHFYYMCNKIRVLLSIFHRNVGQYINYLNNLLFGLDIYHQNHKDHQGSFRMKDHS